MKSCSPQHRSVLTQHPVARDSDRGGTRGVLEGLGWGWLDVVRGGRWEDTSHRAPASAGPKRAGKPKAASAKSSSSLWGEGLRVFVHIKETKCRGN